MNKDLRSYERHNAQYLERSNDYENTLEKLAIYDKIDQFSILGFKQIISLLNPKPKLHIDIGSGNGWLARKTAPLFDRVIGIEPSSAIVKMAEKVNEGTMNCSFMNEDMVDGLKKLSPKEPVFITTATVLNHINDSYVEVFLKEVNNLPAGSFLYFDERYDKNIQLPLWHIRSKDWWIENLPNWQLFFCNYDMAGYSSGIFGIRPTDGELLPSHTVGYTTKALWHVSRLFTIIERIFQKTTMITSFFTKAITFVRNKIYNTIAHLQIAWYSPKKIKNYTAFLEAKKKKISRFVVEFTDGYKLYCDAGFDHEVYAFLEPCVTEDYTRKLGMTIKTNDVVFDIGAHMGTFAVYAASKGAKVYAFEPDPVNYKKLLENIALNAFEDKIIPFNHAITDSRGQLKLASMEGNTGGHSLYLNTGNYVMVETYSFEESVSLAGVTDIDLIKIDTEGAEYTILPNIKPETYKHIKAIIGEYHLLPELPGKNYSYLKETLSPYFSKITHHVPYYFKSLR